MTEEELLIGVTGALAFGGWLYTHARRSDLALTEGAPGVPDLWCVHPARGRLLVLELKTETGHETPAQATWRRALVGAGVDARLVRPDAFDGLYRELLGDRLIYGRKAG